MVQGLLPLSPRMAPPSAAESLGSFQHFATLTSQYTWTFCNKLYPPSLQKLAVSRSKFLEESQFLPLVLGHFHPSQCVGSHPTQCLFQSVLSFNVWLLPLHAFPCYTLTRLHSTIAEIDCCFLCAPETLSPWYGPSYPAHTWTLLR